MYVLAEAIDNDSTVFKATPDGNCAFSSAAKFLYGDEKMGHTLSIKVNEYLRDNFKKYNDKIIFPYEKRVGGGELVQFESEKDYLRYLENPKQH